MKVSLAIFSFVSSKVTVRLMVVSAAFVFAGSALAQGTLSEKAAKIGAHIVQGSPAPSVDSPSSGWRLFKYPVAEKRPKIEAYAV